MKVLSEFDASAPFYVRQGWGKVFNSLGHKFYLWERERCCAFDAFSKIEPDIYIGTSYNQTEDTYRCIKSRPEMKVAFFASAWGPLSKNIKESGYPIVYMSDGERKIIEKIKRETGKPDFVFIHVTDEYLDAIMSYWNTELGIKPIGVLNGADIFSYSNGVWTEEFESDISFVGGYWPYKAKNLDKYFIPLSRLKKYKMKIFGNGDWNIPEHLGTINEDCVKNIFCSAKVCPNISEPHATEFGSDIVERVFKIPCAGGFLISDYVEELKYVFRNGELPTFKNYNEFRELLDYYLSNDEDRLLLSLKQQKTIMSNHTYFHRVAKMLENFGMNDESNNCLRFYKENYNV